MIMIDSSVSNEIWRARQTILRRRRHWTAHEKLRHPGRSRGIVPGSCRGPEQYP
jgi:hypothetical protein